jgi:hypothetical protein
MSVKAKEKGAYLASGDKRPSFVWFTYAVAGSVRCCRQRMTALPAEQDDDK